MSQQHSALPVLSLCRSAWVLALATIALLILEAATFSSSQIHHQLRITRACTRRGRLAGFHDQPSPTRAHARPRRACPPSLPPRSSRARDEVGKREFDIRGNRKLQEIACMVQAISRRNILRRYHRRSGRPLACALCIFTFFAADERLQP